GEITYTCAAEGKPFTMGVVFDTTAPLRMTTGQSTQLNVTVKATLAKSAADAIAGVPVTHVAATLEPTITFGTAATVVAQPVIRTSLREAPPTLLSGASAPFTYTAPATSGTQEVTAGAIKGNFTFDNNNGTPVPKEFSCTAPNGKAPLIDTIAVSGFTTTSLTLARSTSDYGQAVGVSATVSSTAGIPSGEVAFTVGGVVTRVKVDKDGVAAAVLPDSAVGTHTVLATFVPSDVAAFVGSTSVTKLLTVSKAETKARTPVTGRTTKTATHVGVKVRGVFDTVPTGKVLITIKRLGKPGKWVKTRTLSDAGTARFRLRLLAAGRYRVIVKYRGDVNHLAEKKVKVFRVVER
ncbi:MAG TPA: Ig-like domain-containing protein, partial [Nocardioides sp.]|nr:Ig-like domain-containing protein [Nocardioides sp.]